MRRCSSCCLPGEKCPNPYFFHQTLMQVMSSMYISVSPIFASTFLPHLPPPLILIINTPQKKKTRTQNNSSIRALKLLKKWASNTQAQSKLTLAAQDQGMIDSWPDKLRSSKKLGLSKVHGPESRGLTTSRLIKKRGLGPLKIL